MLISKKARQVLAVVVASLVTAFGIFYFSSLGEAAKSAETRQVDPAFSAYISSYTAGAISAGSTIKVRFAQEIVDSTYYGQKSEKRLFQFKPSIKGSAFWIDGRTVEF